ncbi:MAG: hypothetical protein CMQ24_05615 [Gammaproteobacteria bacterium]|nr:hypothetical protein [Gammaproteobacteria bacterium]|tara:strand:+ start:9754 stop:10287 length:534 start_codon:yes stop_codon:yes gene_type:complete
MALKPTIHKASIALADLDRNHYDSLELTIAQHPSETTERMFVRMLAYCINAAEGITFTTGLSTPDEPDIRITSLDDRMLAWIDVGEPSFERLKKACRLAEHVHVYSFNAKSPIWWEKQGRALGTLPAGIWQLDWREVQGASELVRRTMAWSVTIADDTALISTDEGSRELAWRRLAL